MRPKYNFFDLKNKDEYPDDVNTYWYDLVKGFDRDGDLIKEMQHMEHKRLYGEIQRTWIAYNTMIVLLSIKCQHGVFCEAKHYHSDAMKEIVKHGSPGPVIRIITARSPEVSFRKNKNLTRNGETNV